METSNTELISESLLFKIMSRGQISSLVELCAIAGPFIKHLNSGSDKTVHYTVWFTRIWFPAPDTNPPIIRRDRAAGSKIWTGLNYAFMYSNAKCIDKLSLNSDLTCSQQFKCFSFHINFSDRTNIFNASLFCTVWMWTKVSMFQE